MASPNLFDLLNDDAQDQTIVIPVVKKDAKPAANTAAATTSKATPTKAADNKGPRKDGARSGKPRDGDDRAPRGPRFDRTPRDGAPRDGASRGGAPRGGRAPRNGRHGGYDRQSGTGITDSENKENKRLGDPAVSSIEAEKDVLSAEAAEAAAPEPTEPETVVKTLDDFLAEKAAKALKLSLPEARAANAGSDNSQWKDTKVLEVEETGDFIKMRQESVAKTRKGKKETKVLITDIEVRFTEPTREPASPRGAFRGNRGGAPRGGDRARGGRGNSSAPRRGASAPRGAAVNVDDQELFPSLGSK
ncbi:hypothetical protein BGZ76_004825 [Entomortierella beljakovae]|nr:hypothetical protein BGZ76_004825 [Entomortierella beljakovae]